MGQANKKNFLGNAMNGKNLRSMMRTSGAAMGIILCFASGYTAAQNLSSDALPTFGAAAFARTDSQKRFEQEFIGSMTAKFGSREIASRALAAEGWKQLRNGRVAGALDAFNQSWLLNSKNHEPYWGFGAVLSEKGKLKEAIEQLETARELLEDRQQLVQLLTDIGVVRSAYAVGLPRDRELERAQQFSAANQRFAESLEIDSEYSASWREWAISLFKQERYSEAWIKASRAQELKAEPLPADFLRQLNDKIAEQK